MLETDKHHPSQQTKLPPLCSQPAITTHLLLLLLTPPHLCRCLTIQCGCLKAGPLPQESHLAMSAPRLLAWLCCLRSYSRLLQSAAFIMGGFFFFLLLFFFLPTWPDACTHAPTHTHWPHLQKINISTERLELQGCRFDGIIAEFSSAALHMEPQHTAGVSYSYTNMHTVGSNLRGL